MLDSIILHDIKDCEGGEELIEDLLPHVRREEGQDGGHVRDQAEQTERRENYTLAPELEVLPHLIGQTL